MCNLVFSLQEFLKIVPGLTIFPLSFYLAWKKLGTKVIASWTYGFERTLPGRITHVDLTNEKDRPIAVYAIHALINEDVAFEVDRFDPPLILKALESVRIETKPYSRLRVGEEEFEPDIRSPNKVGIFLVLADKVVECKMASHPSFAPMEKFDEYRAATKETNRFNGLVYNENAAYAITYRSGSAVTTAIVDTSGFICRGWDFWMNRIPHEQMASKEQVRNVLEEIGFGKFVDWFAVDDLRQVQQIAPADAPTSTALR